MFLQNKVTLNILQRVKRGLSFKSKGPTLFCKASNCWPYKVEKDFKMCVIEKANIIQDLHTKVRKKCKSPFADSNY